MRTIQELIGEEGADRLRERYGILMAHIGVEEEGVQIFKMKLQVIDYKRMSTCPSCSEKERTLGVGLAEIEYCLYTFLDFGEKNTEEVIHLNNNLPSNGIHMHPAVYAELTEHEKESMRKIEERLKRR